jgi:hypothetical protein
MSDVTKALAPKSDQLNADDLWEPRTIKITDVTVLDTEQPIHIRFEGDNNRPWKPSKTAARCLASIWGTQSKAWVGMSCTIYKDPTVTWAGAAVGGVRVSHMEGIDKPRTLQLTKTRGTKGAVTIQPLIVVGAKPPPDPKPMQDDARAEAKHGREQFLKWWSVNPTKHDAVKPIMEELKRLMAEADAPAPGEQDVSDEQDITDDEPPI